MTRGSTPTIKLITEKNWTGWDVWVTLEEGNMELTFRDDRILLDESGCNVYVRLTQEETLKFQRSAKVQVKGEKDGIVEATLIGKIKVYPILNEEVM